MNIQLSLFAQSQQSPLFTAAGWWVLCLFGGFLLLGLNSTDGGRKVYYVCSVAGLCLVTLLSFAGGSARLADVTNDRHGFVLGAICVLNWVPAVLALITGWVLESGPKALAALMVLSTIQAIAFGQLTEMVTLEKKVLFGVLYGAPIVALIAVVFKAMA